LPDPHSRSLAVELMSNVLFKDKMNLETATLLIGTGHNGKSTYLKIINGLFGDENCSHVSLHDLELRPFMVRELFGKLLNIYGDISNKALYNLTIFKQLISGEPLTVDVKFSRAMKFKNHSKFYFSANDLPVIKEDSDGIFRRFFVLIWPNQFIGKNRILDYDKVILNAEKSGIFNLVLENYKTLKRNREFRHSQTIDEVRSIMRKEANKLIQFTEDYLILDSEAIETKADIYEIYVKFAKENKIVPLENKRFTIKLKEVLPKIRDNKKVLQKGSNQVAVWLGIKLATKSEESKTVSSSKMVSNMTLDEHTHA